MTSKLEDQLAHALAPETEITAEDMAALYVEVEAAAQEADEAASKLREESLDATQSINVAKTASAVAAAELTRDRLRAALPRLEERLDEIEYAEACAEWHAKFAEIEAERDELILDLQERYPALCAELIALVQRIPEVDRKINDLHAAAPSGVWERLEDVQRAARDIEGKFGDAGDRGPLNLLTDLRLPSFIYDGQRQLDWPPTPETVQVTTVATVPHSGRYSANWHEAQIEFDAERAALKQQQQHAAE